MGGPPIYSVRNRCLSVWFLCSFLHSRCLAVPPVYGPVTSGQWAKGKDLFNRHAVCQVFCFSLDCQPVVYKAAVRSERAGRRHHGSAPSDMCEASWIRRGRYERIQLTRLPSISASPALRHCVTGTAEKRHSHRVQCIEEGASTWSAGHPHVCFLVARHLPP